MTSTRRIFTIPTALLLAGVVMTACGGGSPNKSAQTGQTTTSTTANQSSESSASSTSTTGTVPNIDGNTYIVGIECSEDGNRSVAYIDPSTGDDAKTNNFAPVADGGEAPSSADCSNTYGLRSEFNSYFSEMAVQMPTGANGSTDIGLLNDFGSILNATAKLDGNASSLSAQTYDREGPAFQPGTNNLYWDDYDGNGGSSGTIVTMNSNTLVSSTVGPSTGACSPGPIEAFECWWINYFPGTGATPPTPNPSGQAMMITYCQTYGNVDAVGATVNIYTSSDSESGNSCSGSQAVSVSGGSDSNLCDFEGWISNTELFCSTDTSLDTLTFNPSYTSATLSVILGNINRQITDPVASPDGSTLAFTSCLNQTCDLYEAPLKPGSSAKIVTSIPDGSALSGFITAAWIPGLRGVVPNP